MSTTNITTQGTVTPAGVVNFDPNTGARLTTGQSVTVAQGGNTYGSRQLIEPGVYKTDTGYTNSAGQNISYTPAMQTTTSLNRQDKEISNKIDNVSGTTAQTQQQKGANPTVGNVQTTGTNPDGTPKTATPIYKSPDGKATISETPVAGSYAYKAPTTLQEGEKTGYGTDGKRYIIGKDGTTRNDPYADQEYEVNKKEIEEEKNRTEVLDRIQLGADEAHKALIERIKTISAYNRQQMKDTNARYLALKQNEGFSGGQARYMSDINNGVLLDNEQKGIERLNKIDIDEATAIAEAVSAKNDKDFEMATKKFAVVDALQKEKRQAIIDVMKATNDFNQALKEQAKAVADAEKQQFEQGAKVLTTSAPALLAGYNQLKTPQEQQTFLVDYAKRLGIKPEMVLGAIKDQETQETKAEAELQQTYAQTSASNRSNQPDSLNTPKGTVTERRAADIKIIIDDFTAKIKGGWAGANPQAYEYYKKQILDMYGTLGVKELEKAMELQNITVDNTNK